MVVKLCRNRALRILQSSNFLNLFIWGAEKLLYSFSFRRERGKNLIPAFYRIVQFLAYKQSIESFMLQEKLRPSVSYGSIWFMGETSVFLIRTIYCWNLFHFEIIG